MKLFGWRTVYASAILLSVIFFYQSVKLPSQDERAITANLAVALFVSGALGLIHTIFLEKELDQVKIQQGRDRATRELGERLYGLGIRDLHVQRPTPEISTAIRHAERSIEIVGASLRGLIGVDNRLPEQQDLLNALCERVRHGVTLQILLAHPAQAADRELMERMGHGTIPVEILKNLFTLIQRLNPIRNGNWKIALYKCSPSTFSLCVDSRHYFFQPYPLCGTAMGTICFECKGEFQPKTDFGHFFSAQFHEIWTGPASSRRIEIHRVDELAPLISELCQTQAVITPAQRDELLTMMK